MRKKTIKQPTAKWPNWGKKEKTPHEVEANEWVFRTRGAVAAVAARVGVTPQFVYMVLMGKRKSKDGKVERELRKVGAPMKSPSATPRGRPMP